MAISERFATMSFLMGRIEAGGMDADVLGMSGKPGKVRTVTLISGAATWIPA
jgi:hypothetical protein